MPEGIPEDDSEWDNGVGKLFVLKLQLLVAFADSWCATLALLMFYSKVETCRSNIY
jgi:hypothetical protein